MVNVLVLSVVFLGFECRSGHTKYIKIGVCTRKVTEEEQILFGPES